MAKSNPQNAVLEMSPLVNYHDRMYQLVHVTDRQPLPLDASGSPVIRVRDTAITKITPGLNFVPVDILLEVGFDPKHFRNSVVIQDPKDLADDQALALVDRTLSRPALKRWAEVETRQEILEAINQRLAQRGPRALRE